jgi:exodeoxyribonuclease VII small subunit
LSWSKEAINSSTIQPTFNLSIKKIMKKEITYSQAQQKLEEIVAQMENNEIDLETLSVKLIEAKELVKLCENKLRNIEKVLK